MGDFDCRTGCLRDELDENMETLNDKEVELRDNFESTAPEPICQEEIQHFKRIIDGFKEDLELFKRHCLKCKKNGGKLEHYGKALYRAQDLWEVLSC
ncbi:MAG: hypothetical protein NTZ49_00515 [Candidatus Parcubacteria bacterium]|nr:hypothetical protein [Candidatus Parcubacteria bacterium]